MKMKDKDFKNFWEDTEQEILEQPGIRHLRWLGNIYDFIFNIIHRKK